MVFVCAILGIGVYCFRLGNSSAGSKGRIAGIVVGVVFVCAILSIGVKCFRHGNRSDGEAGRIDGIGVAVVFVCAIAWYRGLLFQTRQQERWSGGAYSRDSCSSDICLCNV